MGARIGATMMMAGTASMKQPMKRNAAASTSPTLITPTPNWVRN